MLIRPSEDFFPAVVSSTWFLLAMAASYLVPLWVGTASLQITLAQMWLMFAALSLLPLIRTFTRLGVMGWAFVLSTGCLWLLGTIGVLTLAFGIKPATATNFAQIIISIIYMVFSATMAEFFIRRYVWPNFGKHTV